MKKTVSLRISGALYKHLYSVSREEGVSLSAFIERQLMNVDDKLQIQSLQDRFDLISNQIDELKSGASSKMVIELLKEIAIRLDSRIPSIVQNRLTQSKANHE